MALGPGLPYGLWALSRMTAPRPAADAKPLTSRPARIPGLDGIRALAVVGVMLYHAQVGVLVGGFLGVDVFFVLSGFLVTGLLLGEHDRSGGVDFKHFWTRRL